MSNRPGQHSGSLPFEIPVKVRDTCLCLHLQRAARAVARRFDEALRPLGLTSGQFSLLMSLNRAEPPTLRHVAAVLAMDRTTLTATLKPLERRGLVDMRVAASVVEGATAAVLRDIAEPALAAGRTLIVLSCGALLDNFDLVELARRQGGRILVPTGALLGLDAVQAAAVGEISRVHMITRKPPNGLDGAPYLVEHGISVLGIREPRRVFTG